MIRLLLIVFLFLTSVVEARETYITEKNIVKIKNNWAAYKYAQEKTGVHALALASIHYREADLYRGWYSVKRKKVIKNIGGPFMFDPGPSNDTFEFTRRVRWHEKKLHHLYGDGCDVIPRISHDFNFAAVVAAHHLKEKAKCPLTNIECLVYAFWGYNGRAAWQVDNNGKKTHRKSSYVWADHKNGVELLMRYKKKDGTIKEFIDKRPGVMVIYKELYLLYKAGIIGNENKN